MPSRSSASACRAARVASPARRTTALSRGFTASMRRRHASTISSDDTSPLPAPASLGDHDLVVASEQLGPLLVAEFAAGLEDLRQFLEVPLPRRAGGEQDAHRRGLFRV